MKIPILDLKRQIQPIRGEIDAAIKNIIDNTSFVFGKEIDDFEAKICAYTGSSFAIGVSNGTDAIRLALLVLGIGPGDRVACPAFSYYATAGAIATIKAIPVFTDIDPKTFNMTPESLEKALAKFKRVKAVIPVHLYGQCADMDGILKVAKKHKIKVIEDTAQAFGAEYKGRKAGTIGDCGAVSFFPGKNLGAFGDAGMILTNKAQLSRLLKLLRNQGNEERYFHTVLGFNNRLDTLQASILSIKLKYLDTWNKKRQEIAAYYNSKLAKLDLILPFVAEYSSHIYHQYVIRLKSSSASLIEHLKLKGIDARIYYPVPLHLQKCFKYLGYKLGDFPESEKASKNILAIPVFPDLTQEELAYIVKAIGEFKK